MDFGILLRFCYLCKIVGVPARGIQTNNIVANGGQDCETVKFHFDNTSFRSSRVSSEKKNLISVRYIYICVGIPIQSVPLY